MDIFFSLWPFLRFLHVWFLLGLLEEVANITMATWQPSNHSEQQSLMLLTTFQDLRCVCPFQLKMCHLCFEKTVLKIYTSTSNLFRSDPLDSDPHTWSRHSSVRNFSSFPPPATHPQPLICVLSVAVSPRIPDHSLEISAGFLLAPSPCRDNFNAPAGLKELPGASGSTVCPLTLCLGDGKAGGGG